MKRILQLLVIILTGYSSVNAQGYQWAKKIGSYGVDFGNAMVTDASGNIYVTGQYEFDGFFTGSNASTNFTVRGSHDIFLAKYDSNGNLIWARTAGGKGGDAGRGICIDPAGNVYITGEMEDTAYFGTSYVISKGSNDAFIAKYSPLGSLQWVTSAGGYAWDAGKALAVDASGNVFLTGGFTATAQFGSTSVSTAGGIYKDMFVAKYNPLLSSWDWVRYGGSSDEDEGRGVCVDNAGNVYVTGMYRDNANFEGTILSSQGYWDLFVAKYTNSGTKVWMNGAGGTWDDVGNALVFNNTDQLLYVTGEFRGNATFGGITLSENGYGDVFVAAYNSSGTAQWVQEGGGPDTDAGRGIVLDNSNNIYVGGYHGTTAVFGSQTLMGDTCDAFIARYSPSGSLQWISSMRGTGPEDMVRGIAVDNAGNVFAVGNYNEFSGGPSAEIMIGQQPLTGYSNEDAFILKYSQLLSSTPEVAGKGIVFYPNPAGNFLIIQGDAGIVTIENELGQIVKSEMKTGSEQNQINIADLKAGLYFIRVGNETGKLVVE